MRPLVAPAQDRLPAPLTHRLAHPPLPLCQYNLQLIEDRDAELERYDGAFANLKNALRDRDAEVSDLKVSIDELEAQVRAEQQRAAQVEGYCKDKLTEAKERLEGLRLQVRV